MLANLIVFILSIFAFLNFTKMEKKAVSGIVLGMGISNLLFWAWGVFYA